MAGLLIPFHGSAHVFLQLLKESTISNAKLCLEVAEEGVFHRLKLLGAAFQQDSMGFVGISDRLAGSFLTPFLIWTPVEAG